MQSPQGHAAAAQRDVNAAVRELGQAAQGYATQATTTVKNAAEEARTALGGKIEEIKHRAEDVYGEAKAKAETLYGEARTQIKSVQQQTEDYVRANPLKAIAIAVGAGYIFGNIIRSR